MTNLEKKVLKRVVLRSGGKRLKPYETVSPQSDKKFRAFRKSWREPDDFSESFRYVMDSLPAKEKTVLIRKYENGLTFSEIAKEMGVATSVVQFYERNAILTLSASPYKDILMDGLKRHQMEAENPEKINPDWEKPLSSANLSVRLYNVLRRAGCCTIGDVAKLDSLEDIPFVGPVLTKDIIRAFKKIGIDTAKWEGESSAVESI